MALLSFGKLKVEIPPEERAPGMSITGSMLQIQSHLCDGDVFMGSKLLPTAEVACLRQQGEHLLKWTMCGG